jgi:predicted metalloendopeptidase
MKNKTMLAFCIATALGVAGCDKAIESTPPTTATTEASIAASALKSGIYLTNLDTQIKPQDDFFRYVNGNWLAKTEIPADKSRWGSFDELRDSSSKHVLQIVKDAAAKPADAGSDPQKIGDMFRAFMDTATIEKLGLTPLQADIARIEQLKTTAELATLWGQLQVERYGAPVGVFVGQDQKNSTQYITGINQSGLGLPDRDYYLKSDEKSAKIQKQYQWMIARFWELAGWPDGSAAAEKIFAIETKLANAQWSRVQNRDRTKTYNKMTVAQLASAAPGFDWQAFLAAAELGQINELVVRQPDYLVAFAKIQAEVPLQDWQLYLKFHLLRSKSPLLTSAFEQANFDFYGRVLTGLQEQKPREERAVVAIDDALGFMVGKLYVEKYFKPEAKARMEQLIKNLRVAFEQAINDLAWMSPATKQQAQVKLQKFNAKIGYPEVWRDYSCLTIKADDLVGNVKRSSVCEYQRMIARLGKPVDRNEWGMTPQTVNAYYSSTMNEIVFPAAILQPPFFNVEADDAVNYGGIGGVIGHEITHGFDDQGRRSDGDGNLRDWWTPDDESQFKQRAQLMIDQYNSYNPIDDLHVQGALTLGENIADLGGLTVAYRAYQNSLAGKTAPVIDGFTGEKRLFIGWAQVWRNKARDEALRQMLITDPHSPGMYRVQGILSNMPEFYQAYDVKAGDGMYRPEAQRVKIW